MASCNLSTARLEILATAFNGSIIFGAKI